MASTCTFKLLIKTGNFEERDKGDKRQLGFMWDRSAGRTGLNLTAFAKWSCIWVDLGTDVLAGHRKQCTDWDVISAFTSSWGGSFNFDLVQLLCSYWTHNPANMRTKHHVYNMNFLLYVSRRYPEPSGYRISTPVYLTLLTLPLTRHGCRPEHCIPRKNIPPNRYR